MWQIGITCIPWILSTNNNGYTILKVTYLSNYTHYIHFKFIQTSQWCIKFIVVSIHHTFSIVIIFIIKKHAKVSYWSIHCIGLCLHQCWPNLVFNLSFDTPFDNSRWGQTSHKAHLGWVICLNLRKLKVR